MLSWQLWAPRPNHNCQLSPGMILTLGETLPTLLIPFSWELSLTSLPALKNYPNRPITSSNGNLESLPPPCYCARACLPQPLHICSVPKCNVLWLCVVWCALLPQSMSLCDWWTAVRLCSVPGVLCSAISRTLWWALMPHQCTKRMQTKQENNLCHCFINLFNVVIVIWWNRKIPSYSIIFFIH